MGGGGEKGSSRPEMQKNKTFVRPGYQCEALHSGMSRWKWKGLKRIIHKQGTACAENLPTAWEGKKGPIH